MLAATLALRDRDGGVPRYGDCDDGRALQLASIGQSYADWVLKLGRCWAGEIAASVPAGSVVFQDAGVYGLVSRRGTADEVLCVFDAGPLGFLPPASHGHADALSFTLTVAGKPIIVDTGTYAYHSDPMWRDYFRGTAAHNTIVVDGADQSAHAGIFLWTRHASTRVLAWDAADDGGVVVAQHDGYARSTAVATHRRQVELHGNDLRVVDDVAGQGMHDIEWRLHFDPECSVQLDAERCRVGWEGGSLTIDLDPALHWRLARGASYAGWFSRGFNLKEPTVALVGHARVEVPLRLENRVVVSHAPAS